MSPEEKALIEKTLELEKENNHLLRSIKRSMRISGVMNTIYWIFIIGSAVGAYYLIQPYVAQLTSIYGQASHVLDNLRNSKQ